MNDLTSIIDRILSDARADADAILARANEEAKSVEAEYREKASARKSELCAAFAEQLSGERLRAESGAAMEEKSRVLQEKTALIARCIDSVERALSEGYAATYAPFFLNLLEQGAIDADATLVFSDADLHAETFFKLAQERYASLYPERKLYMERSSQVPTGGFHLRYAHLSSPCTAHSVVEFSRLMLETRANKLLFESENA